MDKPGTFTVLLTYSLESGVSDTRIAISMGEQNAATKLPPRLGLDDYKTEKIGEITMKEAGESELVLKTTKASGARVMNLQSISLVPVSKE